MTSARIRPLEDRDYQALASTLNSAFASYRDATVYANPMLAYFREWMWSDAPSLVLSDGDQQKGVLLAGVRSVRFDGVDLRVLHIGPFGIVRSHRRQGWGTKMLRDLRLLAQNHGADLLTLTTESIYGAHRLYRREGFDPIEAYRPKLSMLSAASGNLPPFRGTHTCSDIRPIITEEPLGKHLMETGPTGPPLPAALRPNRWELNGGRAATIQWSIVTRQGDRETLQKVSQVIEWVPGESPEELFQAARERAAAEGSVCLYALGSLSRGLPQLRAKGSSMVYRMGRALTDKGAFALKAAKHYTEIAPAP
ncbi:MAG: GNAT family N-acetyltransferase [Myxococcota bacterium]|nr:GNAT family N-acetyltransferase [Myxococcota bacterium]